MIAIAEVSSVKGFLEPISIIGTCATEAMWDAGRGGEPEAICRYCKGSRQRDAPTAPRPTRVAARARGRRSSACAYTRRCDPGAGHSAALERVLAHLRGRIPGRTSGPLLLPAARRLLRYPP